MKLVKTSYLLESHPSELIETFNRDFGPYFALLGNCFIDLDNLFIHVITTNLSKEEKRVRFPDESEVKFPIQNIRKNISCLVALWSNVVAQFGTNNNTMCEFGECYSPRNSSVLAIDCYSGVNALKENISTIFNLDVRNDLSVLELAISPLQRVTKLSHKCVRWKTELGLWSGEDCSSKGASDGAFVGCECSSPANSTFSFFYSANIRMISISSLYAQFILGGISMFALFLTLIFLLAAHASKVQCQLPPPLNHPNIKRHRFAMQFSLTLSMFGFHSILVLTSAASELRSNTSCFVVAALFHFFLLATAIWLLNQSISLFMKISDDFTMQLNYKKLTTVQLVIGWVVPLIMVAVTCGAIEDGYLQDDIVYYHIQTKTDYQKLRKIFFLYYDCTINRSNQGIFVSTIVVIGFIMVADAAVTIRALFIIKRLSQQQMSITSSNRPHDSGKAMLHKLDHLRSLGRSLLILLPVSTIPWLIYMFALLENSGVVQEVHAYTSWIQGVAVFVLFCVLNRVDREKLAIEWKRSSIRNRFRNVLNCWE